MIDARELRLNNWVSKKIEVYTKEGKEYATTYWQIGAKDIIRIAQHNDTTYYLVLLTPKILEKCGFEAVEAGEFISYTLDITSYIKSDGISRYTFIGRGIKGQVSPIIICYRVNDTRGAGNMRYLHQLQNLFYGLTGDELEVNLSV